jgi:hypothetical protein
MAKNAEKLRLLQTLYILNFSHYFLVFQGKHWMDGKELQIYRILVKRQCGEQFLNCKIQIFLNPKSKYSDKFFFILYIIVCEIVEFCVIII